MLLLHGRVVAIRRCCLRISSSSPSFRTTVTTTTTTTTTTGLKGNNDNALTTLLSQTPSNIVSANICREMRKYALISNNNSKNNNKHNSYYYKKSVSHAALTPSLINLVHRYWTEPVIAECDNNTILALLPTLHSFQFSLSNVNHAKIISYMINKCAVAAEAENSPSTAVFAILKMLSDNNVSFSRLPPLIQKATLSLLCQQVPIFTSEEVIRVFSSLVDLKVVWKNDLSKEVQVVLLQKLFAPSDTTNINNHEFSLNGLRLASKLRLDVKDIVNVHLFELFDKKLMAAMNSLEPGDWRALSTLLFALGKMRVLYKSIKALQYGLNSALEKCVPQMEVVAFINTLFALGTLKCHMDAFPVAVVDALFATLDKQFDNIPNDRLYSIFHSLGQLSCSKDSIPANTCQRLLQRVHQACVGLDGLKFSQLMFGLAKMQVKAKDLLEKDNIALQQALEKNWKTLNASNFVNVVHGVSAMEMTLQQEAENTGKMKSILFEFIPIHTPHLIKEQLSTLIVGLGAIGLRAVDLPPVVFQSIEHKLQSQLRQQQSSETAFVYLTRSLLSLSFEINMFSEVTQSLFFFQLTKIRLQEWNVQNISSIIYCIGRLQVRFQQLPTEFTQQFFACFNQQQQHFHAQEISNMLYGLGLSGCCLHDLSEQTQQHILDCLTRSCHTFKAADTCVCLFGLGAIGWKKTTLPTTVLNLLLSLMEKQVNSMSPKSFFCVVHGLEQLHFDFKELTVSQQQAILTTLNQSVKGASVLEVMECLGALSKMNCDYSQQPQLIEQGLV